ncbi:MAG TPA: TIGR01459 family HAD-type hydrolase, partial [Xanthobacteraceae bacterium]|nr:TIGR01459 family HAD-type hydrolase [Xanthobacteraceae bacterium]
MSAAPIAARRMPIPPAFIDGFAALAPQYDVLLCDVWGVVHNGVRAFAEACDALARFRAGGGTALLITNAPRPAGVVVRLLDRLDVPHGAYDGIVSSGDVTQDVMLERRDQRVFTIGPQRDLPTFTELGIKFAPAESADYVVCTGLFDDDTETPDDYRVLLADLRARDLFMVCANPDLVVERGERL